MPVSVFFPWTQVPYYCFWLLVTLFPLSDGGVLVAVTTCAVLRGGGYYLVPALSVAYLLAYRL